MNSIAVSETCEQRKSPMLSELEDSVREVYEFRDRYHEDVNKHEARDKWDHVKLRLSKCLDSLDPLLSDTSSQIPPASVHYLIGRVRNALPDFDKKAQDHLSVAVKLDPSYIEAWNELGECYWKSGNAALAKQCFSKALEKKRNKASLRNLSVVLRQTAVPSPEERRKTHFNALEMAEEAVKLDLTDGESWLILGNAYLSVAFYGPHHQGYLKRALGAYDQAAKCELSRGNPDVYFNKAVALTYDERYQESLQCLERAKTLDPTWDLINTKEESLLQFARGLSQATNLLGKLKSRKLNSILKSLGTKDLGPYTQQKYGNPERILLKDLIHGVNRGKFILGKVIASVPCEGGTPFACCLSDSDKDCVAVTIYRLAQGYGMSIGDSILVLEPLVRQVTIAHHGEIISYRSIRVDSPHQTLLVNGRPLRNNEVASLEVVSSTRID